ncbi:MAG TPA: cytochrome c oxidase subunit II, partial [Solirubrobacteraceae bacterium]|nr:cytochrome c oxidase subunit II [Solirubrobacteraceae bacterium]
KGLPMQKHEHPLIESSYVLVLAGIAATLLFFTYTSMNEVDANLPPDSGRGEDEEEFQSGDRAPRPDVVIKSTASRWNWRFDYPQYGITQVGTGTTIPELVVPAGVVRFDQASVDVIHSFFIPHLRFKRDAFPGRLIRFTLRFSDPGYYPGECAEYCGLRHAYMKFNTRVLPLDEFRRWAQRRRAGEPQKRYAAPGLGEPNTAFQEVEKEDGEVWVAPRGVDEEERSR